MPADLDSVGAFALKAGVTQWRICTAHSDIASSRIVGSYVASTTISPLGSITIYQPQLQELRPDTSLVSFVVVTVCVRQVVREAFTTNPRRIPPAI